MLRRRRPHGPAGVVGESGLLALEFDNPKVLAKAEQQLDEEIGTSRNHASIILWSMANETPNTEARTQFIETLAARARALDSTRLITAALLVRGEGHTKIVDDALGSALDVIGVNDISAGMSSTRKQQIVQSGASDYQKPLIVSEFGGGAKAGLHGGDNDPMERRVSGQYLPPQFGMLNRIPQLRGMSPWLLMDFRSPKQAVAGISGMNSIARDLSLTRARRRRHSFVLPEGLSRKCRGKTGIMFRIEPK